MNEPKKWPQPGDRLVHRSRKHDGSKEAVVLSVDQAGHKICVRMGADTYGSLSAAARAITGHATNGWIFWGLKKQSGSRRKTERAGEGGVA